MDFSLNEEQKQIKALIRDFSKREVDQTRITEILRKNDAAKTIEEIRAFGDDNFKFKHYRGTAAFDRATTHTKGYTIYLTDKQLYMTIIASRHNTKTGVTSYIAIMYIGD